MGLYMGVDGPDMLMPENPKHYAGQKKAPLHFVLPVAIIKESYVMRSGAEKYGEVNWRRTKIRRSDYLDAALRHLMAMIDGQDIDPESGQEQDRKSVV